MFGSITGLGDWLGLAFASAFYCIGFGGYLADDLLAGTMFAIPSINFGLFVLTDIQIGAIIAGVLFVGINYIGAKETGGIQTVIVLLLLSILTVFAFVGWFSFSWGTLTADGFTPQGYDAILPATGLVFVSFLGYAKIATVAEEMKNPSRNLPIAVVGSVAIVTVIYTILVALMVGIISWDTLDDSVPVSQVAELSFSGWPVLDAIGVTMITFAALLATASSANASILSSARINFAMGRDKIVTDWLNDIHPKFATPYRSILVTGLMILVFIVVLGQDLAILATAASVLHLIVYALMNIALIAFREGDVPEYDPDFTVPLYPITPIIGATASLGLIYFIRWEAQVLSLLFVLGAVAWYFLYARGQTTVEGALGRYIRERPEEMPDFAVSAAEAASPDSAGGYNVMVPITNPSTENELVSLGATMAEHNGGTVHAVHIIEVPDQTSLEYVSEQLDRVDHERDELMRGAQESAADYDVELETHTVVSHRPFDELFDTAERLGVDTVVMGWSPRRPWASGRTGSALDELTMDLPCDFLVFKDRGLDPSRVLLPTAGGPDSDLSAEAAKALREIHGSEISVLHIVDEATDQAKGMSFIGDWADNHGLGDANLIVEATSDVEAAIEAEVDEHTLLLMGATRRGLLRRLLQDSLVFDVVDEVDCSVLLSERPSKRSLRTRLFGKPTGDKRTAVEESETDGDASAANPQDD